MFTSNVYSITTNSCDDVFSRINQSRVLFVAASLIIYNQWKSVFKIGSTVTDFPRFFIFLSDLRKSLMTFNQGAFHSRQRKVQFSEAAMFTSKGKINGFWNSLSKTLRRSL